MPSPDAVIRFENVSKRYVRRPRTVLESLSALAGRLGLGRGVVAPAVAEFWAIQNVTFEVTRGEAVGIVGANGAGKSTILKLIAGITAPTSGSVQVEGRLATLIELGAGFNLDLTGRENIYLNGAVLGLSRREIDEHFDRIVAFSGLAEFLDVPVKYYSSGMYARLGFSIAAHVQAEIILTDEILAVGDVLFQRQCLKKIQALKSAATILFVSHDLAAIRKVCSRVLWLKDGRVQLSGEPEPVIEAYLRSVQANRDQNLRAVRSLDSETGGLRKGSGEIEIVGVETLDSRGQACAVFKMDDALTVRIRYLVKGPFRDPGFCVNICSQENVFIHGTNTFIHERPVTLTEGEGTIDLRYSALPLLTGTYWLTVGVASENDWSAPYDLRERVRKFEVLSTRPDGGLVCIEHQWSDCVPVREQDPAR
ncbi:MAG: ABC transporter ATP-binding protein [Nitrospira sp.]|nr:ABC transporter ATP-binding protein [Nitrospira sp.]